MSSSVPDAFAGIVAVRAFPRQPTSRNGAPLPTITITIVGLRSKVAPRAPGEGQYTRDNDWRVGLVAFYPLHRLVRRPCVLVPILKKGCVQGIRDDIGHDRHRRHGQRGNSNGRRRGRARDPVIPERLSRGGDLKTLAEVVPEVVNGGSTERQAVELGQCETAEPIGHLVALHGLQQRHYRGRGSECGRAGPSLKACVMGVCPATIDAAGTVVAAGI
jgi:hypothetical protein